MFSKLSLGVKISSFLALIFLIPGLYLQFFSPQHLLHSDDIGFALMIAGLAFSRFGSFLFAPLLLLAALVTIDLIPQISSQVSHTARLVVIAFAAALGLWGWWWERKAQTAQKKLN